jgi:immune inhibitor A
MIEEKNNKTLTIVIVVIVLLCFCCLVLLGVTVYGTYKFGKNIEPYVKTITTSTPEPPIAVTRPPVGDIPTGTLDTLESTIVPENDVADIACRLQGKCNIPATVESPSINRQVGEQQTFWATNVDTNDNFQVDATLRYVTPHVYFWVQNGVDYNEGDLEKLANTFENQIYPTDREFFGSEWTPGVDGDPHIYILYAKGLGFSLAGYFSSADEYNPQAHEYSNAHEMFLFNADNMSLRSQDTYGTLAHEFQHMIHWYQDRNESSWMNEGFSMLAELLNNYPIGFDYYYINNPDLQLTDWSPNPGDNGPHYGAGFLFTTYFLDRFGNEATQALVRDPQNGMESVDDVLKQVGAQDGLTGKPITADDLTLDWMITNYLQDGSVADGRFTYHNYPQAPKADPTETITECPHNDSYRVHQYGADYYKITCSGDYTLSFTGSTVTGLLPEDAHSGSYAFWSNKGDESDMILTRSFDLTDVSGPVTLSYWTWYDLEKDYDYLYLEVSEDGKSWQIITTPSGTADDPSGNSFGWAYNGLSNGWIQEKVDLSQYAGKNIQVRFEYVTDAAVNGEGLLLDDISIPEIGYSTDFESGNDGWEGDGFVRIENVLPQTFKLALISHGSGGTKVEYIPVNADQTAEIPIKIGGDVTDVTLVVTGTTRFTRIQADYELNIH